MFAGNVASISLLRAVPKEIAPAFRLAGSNEARIRFPSEMDEMTEKMA
jgi:hypothetical protein